MIRLKKIFNNNFLNCDIRYNELLSKHTSFGIGGESSCMVFPTTKRELIYILETLSKNKIKYYMLGSGSNVLASDKGYSGVVISLKKTFKSLDIKNNIVTVESGVMLGTLVKEAVKRNFGGLESLGGVPGTVGGAIYMNAGAFGSEISNYLLWSNTIDCFGKEKRYYKHDINFSYRYSSFPEDEIITESCFEFFIDSKESIKELKLESSNKRKHTQPLKFRSAGSIFKNPNGQYSAGYLIDNAGLKGVNKGGAEISDLHANFIINKNNASYEDILFLIELIKKTVKEKFNIRLELEIKLLN